MKRSGYKWIHLIICISVAGIICGCGSSEKMNQETENDLIVIGFSEVGAESDWRVANTESMRNTFLEEDGYELLFNDAKQKQDNQIAAIRNYILQEVDYIVLAPIVETGWDEVLQEARDAHIPVIVIDRMTDVEDESLYTAWVGSDFRKEGDMAVEWLAQKLEEQGRENDEINIVHVLGTEGASAQLGRTAGLEAGLREHPNWKIVSRVEGEFTQAKTYEMILELVRSGTEMDVIYCENDNSAFGAIQALEKEGISCGPDGDVMIISCDATRGGLTYCLEGKIDLDVECNPLHGPRVKSIIEMLENGETPEKKWFVSETYFTKENLSEEFIDSREY